MLVDLGRNDLGRVARPGTVTVTKYMEVERYSHVLHLVSHVEARLRPDLDALDALRAVFPAGTLSGAPKVRAMQLIAAAEGERRGLYGGAVGYLGYDGNLDTAITIRSAVLKEGRAHVHTGAGIVAGSVPGEGVRGDRAQGGGDPAGDRAGRRRSAAPSAGAAVTARRVEPVEAGSAAMILVIDNYDSFTFNLVQALQAAGADGARRAQRRDRPGRDRGAGRGPGGRPARDRRSRPARATRTTPASRWTPIEVAREREIPLLGVCLGHAVDGRGLRRVDRPRADARPRRGRRGDATTARGCSRACRREFMAARYHSLCVDPATLPRRAARDRDERGGRGRHGPAPRRAPAGGRAVPSRERAHAAGPAPARQLPAARRRGRGVAARRGVGLIRDLAGARPEHGGRGAPDERARSRRAGGDRRGRSCRSTRRASRWAR